MRKTIGGIFLATALLVPPAAFAGEPYQRPTTYTLVVPGALSKGASSFIKAHANPAAAKAWLAQDPVLAAELQAHGVQLRNVIGIEKAMNGRLIVYIK